MYGISNTTALVTFNQTNGVVTTVANLSVSGIESLAFRPSDGALFGATQSKLYTINPANGTATSVGGYGSPHNLGTTGQNIRFAQDGNLYVSNTSTNTDIYRVNTTNGAATWMGEAVGYPYLMLENASSNMYGVYINLGSSTNRSPELVNLNLSSFVVGGTNANGSTHQITINLVGAGTNFPANFNFSGNVPQAVTNLTVPVSATGPSNQTTVVGSNVVFSTIASGTGPYNYAWSKNGAAISGQTNSSLTLNNVTTADAATYSVIVGGAMGTVTNSATLTVNKAAATVTLASLSQTYDGSAKAVTATTTPTGLTVAFTYNGSSSAPTNAGSYTVIGTINDSNYSGSATNTLVISKGSATITLGSLSQTYSGSAEAVTATTTPTGLAVAFTYNGSSSAPTNAGSYTVVGTINNSNYSGSATNTLVISKGSATITLGSLSQTYTGTAKAATATTIPTGLTVSFTYNGAATVPTNAGSYTVIGTINDANYQGSATNTLVISQASASVTLGSLSQMYSGTARAATATTIPSGLMVNFTYNGAANVPTNAGSYTVIGTINDANYPGSATNTLVISQASASVTLGSLNQTYTGTAKAATATTTPSGLTVSFTYNGSATVPTAAGTYTVIGTINDANYQGSATGTLVIGQATATISLGSLSQTYDGSAKAATATTTPSGLTVNLTYNGSATVPTAAGTYTVVATINDANYQGSATGTLVIGQASAPITLGSLNQTYNGSAKAATATTTPSGLAVSFTYNGSATVPTAAGSYTVVATINDANYQGSATGTLVIGQASGSITLGSLSQTYDGSARSATATTTPSGLTVNFTYNGSATVPTAAGSYTVVATINDANYQGNATGTLVIGQATATISLGSLSQNYDGLAKAATATTTPGGLAVTFTYNGSATVPTAAGTYTVVATINDANYQGSATGTLMINTMMLTVTNLLALDKVYDGTTNATLDATNAGLTGMLNSDDVTLVASNAVAYFADKNVGPAKPVTVAGLALGGAAAANYTLADPTNLMASISAAELTVVGVTSASKVYDSTINAQLNGAAALNGAVSGDDVSLITDNASAAFAGSNVGTGLPVNVSGYAITGADAGNYTLTQPTGLAADITAATLTITATANTKIYDGNTSAAAVPTVSGLQGSDTVTGLAETYDTQNAGTGKTLSVSSYTVNDGNSGGNYTVNTVTSTAGVIEQAIGSVTLGSLSQTYDGSAKAATATTTPSGLTVNVTYNGSATVPTAAGSYTVVAAINDANYQGNATGTLVIGQATATISLGSLSQTYDGSAKAATATTTPSGLTVNFTYNGSATVPTAAGSYTVVATINDANYQGSATGSLMIGQASAPITLGSLNQTYNGSAKAATATTTPSGLTVNFTYNGSATVPTAAGTYTVVATINDANYQGSATGTLVIGQATATISLGSLSQNYDGSAKAVTATTTPSGLAVTFTYNGSVTIPTAAGTYTVVATINDANYQGSATGTLMIGQASAPITLGSLNQTYNGSAKAATATTTPSGLAVSFTYNGSANVPTNAGSYTVIGTINDANYQGSATNTLVISQASASVTLGSLNQTYSGTAKAATATTTPSGLTVSFTYNGSATVPTAAGTYTVIGTINDANYQGSATGTLVIGQATATISLGSLSQTYDGSAKAATATTTPSGLTVNLTYNGSATVPTAAGTYTVVATINDANYQGSATGTLVIGQASAPITLGSLNQTYNGSAKAATATTTPGGLAVTFTYNGSATVPTAAGTYTVVATINDANYQGSATGTLMINTMMLTVTNLLALDKVYDGTTNATLDATNAGLTGMLNSDDVTLVASNAVAYFADKNVGPAKPVTVAGLALGGAAAANYTLADPTNLMASISAAELTVVGVTSASKVYDSTINAQLNGAAALNGAVSGDDVSLITDNASAAFAGSNVGTGLPVNVSGYAITGADAGNYTLTQPTGLAADITAATLTITATANTKIYDGNTSAAAVPTVSGLQGSDTVTGLAETYDTQNAGTGKTLSVSSYTVNDGNSGGNYTVNTVTSTAGVIEQAIGSVTLGSLSQTYDGSAKAATATTTPTGLTVSFTYNGSATVPTAAGSYTVIATINDANYQGSATGTLVIGQATATISLGSLSQTYNGSAKAATATTTPTGLTVSFTYNGSATVPTAAGTYTVVATINDANYQGSATGTLVIGKASGSITLGSLSQTYDGSAKAVTATTTPSGLAVSFTYNGSATVPTAAGSYTVIATINDANYQGNATGTLVIGQASAPITLGSLNQTYNGSAKAATATTIPSGLAVNFTYNGSATVPTAAGTYTVVATINDANYQGSATGTLVIGQASAPITLGSLNQTYNGSAKAATATTIPSGLAVTFTYNGSATVPTAAGSYTVIGTINDTNYTGSATNTLVINKVTLTVMADNKTKIYGMPNPPLTASYNGFVGGDNANVLVSPVVLNTTATTTSDAGKYPITAGGAVAANYTIQYVDGTLQVFSAPQLAGANVSMNGMEQFIVSWPTIAGQTYQLEYATDLSTAKWTPLGTPFAGTDGIVSVTNNMSGIPQCFFRVEVQ